MPDKFNCPSGNVVIHSAVPWVPISTPQAMLAGSVRFNQVHQRLETFDGSSWLSIEATHTVDLSPEVKSILDWGIQQKNLHAEYEKLSLKYTAVADALATLKESEQKLQVIATLCKQ